MALASILVGILVGITSFMVSLIMGQGLIAAAGFYVMGGFIAACLMIALSLLRGFGESAMERRTSSYTLRG